MPTLVLNGDLDLRTDVYQAREVARNFRGTPTSRCRTGHVTALYRRRRVRGRSFGVRRVDLHR